LLDASVAAYERARSLDPGVVTSVAQTLLLKGEWQMAVAVDRSDPPFTRAQALVRLGRTDEALVLMRGSLARGLHPQLRDLVSGMIAALEGRHEDVIEHTHRVLGLGFADHEVFYHWAGALAAAGDHDGALTWLERAVEGGFHPVSALASDPRFDSIRHLGDFKQIARRAESFHQQALDIFRSCGGPRLLGLPA
jgi:tetratricopeptide (TPR) repeat protein